MYNTKLKVYPDGTIKRTVCNVPIFNAETTEKTVEDEDIPVTLSTDMDKILDYAMSKLVSYLLDDTSLIANKARAQARARASIYDLCMCNNFKYFLTITLDQNKIESRENMFIIQKKLNTWLSNMVSRYDAKYICVPEHHADGVSVHFHALMSGNLRLKDSGHKTKDGRKIYNLDQWKYGFSTCIEIDENYEACVKYIIKYITKNVEKIGGRWYLHGGNLIKPEQMFCNINPDEWEKAFSSGDIFNPAGTSLQFIFD